MLWGMVRWRINMNTEMKTDKCPKCGISWRDEKGWGINLLGLEIRGKYDGVSYWKCTACNTTFDRWTGEEVKYDIR